MFGLGKAAAKVSDATFGTDFSAEVAEQLEEVTNQYNEKVKEKPIVLTAKQMGSVKPYVKDPQTDFNNLVELFGVLGEPVKYILCSCPECDHEEKGLHSQYSSTAMDMTVACSECGYEDEFAEFYDSTVSEFETSRKPTLLEIIMTVGVNDVDDFDEDDEYHREFAEKLRRMALKYYAILSGKAEPEHPGDRYGPITLSETGNYVVKHSHGWFSGVDDLRYFGVIKSLQQVSSQIESDDNE